MTRKPSVSKQIATVLDTPDKTVQLERINQLLQTVQAPNVSVTVLLSKGRVEVGVVGDTDVSPEGIKNILRMGVDEVTKKVAEFEAQQQPDPTIPAIPEGAEYVPLDEPVAVPLNDSEIPDNMFPEPTDGEI
jgi:hypothetical protein